MSSKHRAGSHDSESQSDDGSNAHLETSLLSRTYKACRRCRRLKMKCEPLGGLPCKRCEIAKADCVFDRIKKRKNIEVDVDVAKRVMPLESQFQNVQNVQQEANTQNEGRPGMELPSNICGDDSAMIIDPCPSAAEDYPRRWPPRSLASREFHEGAAFNCNVSAILPSSNTDNQACAANEDAHSKESTHQTLANITSEDLHAPLSSVNELAAQHCETPLCDSAVRIGEDRQVFNQIQRSTELESIFILSPNARSPKRCRTEVSVAQERSENLVASNVLDDYQARVLFNGFLTECGDMFPILDPIYDTFDSLSRRSPFLLQTVLAIASKIKFHGTETLKNPDHIYEAEARRLAGHTLFRSSPDIEDVQGITLLAAYSQSCWNLLGHAIRMALSLHLNGALSRLLAGNFEDAAGQTTCPTNGPTAIAKPSALVRQARTWLILVHLEREISSGTGRASLIGPEEIYYDRQLLRHSLSLPIDRRVLANIELVILRDGFHQTVRSEDLIPGQAIHRIQNVSIEFDRWLAFWDDLYKDRGYHLDSLQRISLRMQRNYAEIFVSCAQLGKLSKGHSVWLDEGIHAEETNAVVKHIYSLCAERQLPLFLENHSYQWHFRSGPTYAALMVSFAAALALKIAKLRPNVTNKASLLQQVGRIADILEVHCFAQYYRPIRLLASLLGPADRILSSTAAFGEDSVHSTSTFSAIDTSSVQYAVDPSERGSTRDEIPGSFGESWLMSQDLSNENRDGSTLTEGQRPVQRVQQPIQYLLSQPVESTARAALYDFAPSWIFEPSTADPFPQAASESFVLTDDRSDGMFTSRPKLTDGPEDHW